MTALYGVIRPSNLAAVSQVPRNRAGVPRIRIVRPRLSVHGNNEKRGHGQADDRPKDWIKDLHDGRNHFGQEDEQCHDGYYRVVVC